MHETQKWEKRSYASCRCPPKPKNFLTWLDCCQLYIPKRGIHSGHPRHLTGARHWLARWQGMSLSGLGCSLGEKSNGKGTSAPLIPLKTAEPSCLLFTLSSSAEVKKFEKNRGFFFNFFCVSVTDHRNTRNTLIRHINFILLYFLLFTTFWEMA